MKMRWIILAVGVLSIVGNCLGRTLSPDLTSEWTDDGLGEGMSKAQLYKCHGMDEDTCDMHRIMMAELRQRVSIATGQPAQRETGEREDDYEGLENCIILTVEQLDVIMNNLDVLLNSSASEGNIRKKRNLVDFKKQPYNKWTMPIKYRFDGEHDEAQRVIIRNAAQHWMDNTCVRFTEIPQNVQLSYQHILFTRQQYSCYSYVGQVTLPTPFQQVNLGDSCLYRFGTPVHELGHSLGLFHEQMRADRDEWITVFFSNIVPNYASQFYSQFNTDPLGVPYDYSSVMHYSSLDGVSANGKDSMVAKNPLYQMNMGQRTGLSFNDIRLINRAYCADTCSGRPLSRPCQYGGYQNPNDCSRCLCPDGLGGDFCEKVAESRNAQCGGEIRLSDIADRQTIMTPGYENPSYYLSYQECSWRFKAPEGYNLQLKFDGPFGIYCQDTACYHWVEIKYKADIGLEGARFCCFNRPNVIVKSESNEMLVVFKSNFSANYFTKQRGFKAHVTLVKGNSSPVGKGRSPPSLGLNWQCSFEPVQKGGDALCGMTQDTTDNFDWTLNKGPTPSDPTGPDFAADKDYYMFIEASEPRRPNDQARLFLPDFKSYTGEACVKFSYHMYGFHIRTLKLVEVNKSSRAATELWSRNGRIDNKWHEASVNVRISGDKRLQFIGIRGKGYSGDIGLDNIRVTSSRCVQ